MFDFLNSIFLYALPIVFIPVIIHLFGIKRPITQVFAPFPILLLIKNRIIKRKRLHSIILIILRALLLLFILLSFAGMYIRVGKSDGKFSGKCLLVVDNSPSVEAKAGGRSVGELIVEDIERYIKENSSICERFVVHRLVEQDRFEISAEEIKSEAFFKRLFSRGRYIQLYEDLMIALKQNSTEERFAKMALFSDLYSHSLQNVSTLLELVESYKVEVRYIRLNPVSNVYVEQSRFERTAENEVILLIDLINGGESPFYGSVSLFEGNEMMGLESVNIPPHSKKEVKFKFSFDSNKDRERFFKVAVDGDDFDYDNTEFLYYKSQRGRKILLVNGEPASVETKSETFFLSSAIKSYFGDSVQLYTVLEDMLPETPELYDAIVLSNVNRISINAELISKYVRSGGKVLITLGSRVDAQDYNSVDFLPCNISLPAEMTPEEGFEIKDNTFGVEIGDITNLFKKVRIKKIFDVECFKESKIILETRGNRPLLISRRYGDGLVYLYTSSIDMDMNDLPIRKDYLPFVASLFKGMFSGFVARKIVYSSPYEDIFIQGVNCAGARMINIKGEILENRLTCRGLTDNNYSLKFKAPELSGFYNIRMADTEILLIVNVDKRESELIRFSPEQIKSLLQKKDRISLGGITNLRFGDRDLNLIEFLLLCAAFVLLLEMVVMNKK